MKKSDGFSRLLGNEALKADMRALLDSARTPHAVLFTGEPGTGKTLAARLFAADYLGDENGLAERGVHPDCLEIAGQGASGMITVESVRGALYELNKSAVTTDGRRAAIIKDAACLNRNSGNALLKMLEEPPDGVIFLITAGSEDELLSTILSRCVKLRVRPLPVGLCASAAAELFKENARTAELSRVFGGRLGLVKEVLSSPERLSFFDCAKRFASAALRGDKLAAISELDCASTRDELKTLFRDAAAVIRAELEADASLARRAKPVCDGLAERLRDVDRNINLKLLCAETAARL